MNMEETITWHPALAFLPDSDRTVYMIWPGELAEMGWYEKEFARWVDIHGAPVEAPEYWAELLKGPQT